MPFIVTAVRTPRGVYVVNPCPSCGGKHRHQKAGTVTARCGMRYAILPPPPNVRRTR